MFDFFLQTDEQAKGKSKSNDFLYSHLLTYSIGLALMALMNPQFNHPIIALVWILVNAVAHFFTDYVTSRASSLLFEKNNYNDAFVVIGADQMIHYVTLFGTFLYFTR